LRKREKEKAMLKKYLHHCATLIQKTWRGYAVRVKYTLALEQMRHFQSLVWAMVAGSYRSPPISTS
jgi:Myosin heavy chain